MNKKTTQSIHFLSIHLLSINLSTFHQSIFFLSIYLLSIYLSTFYLSIFLLYIYLSTLYLSIYFLSICIFLHINNFIIHKINKLCLKYKYLREKKVCLNNRKLSIEKAIFNIYTKMLFARKKKK